MMNITLTKLLALPRCEEWTDARTTAFCTPLAIIPIEVFVTMTGVEGITDEELYWGVIGHLTPKQRRQWCLELMTKLAQAYPDAGVTEMLDKMTDFLSRSPTKQEQAEAIDRARHLEREARVSSGYRVTKSSRFRRMAISLMERTDMFDESMKIARMAIAEHSNVDYANLNKYLVILFASK